MLDAGRDICYIFLRQHPVDEESQEDRDMSSFIKLLLYVEMSVITVCVLFIFAGANHMSLGSLLFLSGFTLAVLAAAAAHAFGISYYATYATSCLGFGALTAAFSFKFHAAISSMGAYGRARDALETRSVLCLVLMIAAIAAFAAFSRNATKETGIRLVWLLGIHAVAAATILGAIAGPREPYTVTAAVVGCTCILLVGLLGRRQAFTSP